MTHWLFTKGVATSLLFLNKRVRKGKALTTVELFSDERGRGRLVVKTL